MGKDANSFRKKDRQTRDPVTIEFDKQTRDNTEGFSDMFIFPTAKC